VKGNAAKESAVWELLRRLQVDPGVKHEVFGAVKKLVTEEFVRQKYLEYNRIPHTDPPEFEFQWGAWAAKETSKMQILAWSTKYTEAAAEEAAVGGLFQDISTAGDTVGASQGARRRTHSPGSQHSLAAWLGTRGAEQAVAGWLYLPVSAGLTTSGILRGLGAGLGRGPCGRAGAGTGAAHSCAGHQEIWYLKFPGALSSCVLCVWVRMALLDSLSSLKGLILIINLYWVAAEIHVLWAR
uniref:MAGE domain-containing protein n=1 Tax=Gopherus agassizii TaxID=38772 RepID=A0A452HZ52_9SAUR